MLEKSGILTYDDVLMHLPRKYDSFALSSKETLLHMKDKERVVIFGKLIGRPELLKLKNISSVKFVFSSTYGYEFRVVAWNRPYLAASLNEEDDYTLQANYDAKRHCLNFVAMKKGRLSEEDTFQPVYSLPLDYQQHLFRELVRKALRERSGQLEDAIPDEFRQKYRLLPKEEALKKCHFPVSLEDIYSGSRVLKYEEALLFSLKNQLIRKKNKTLTRNYTRRFDHKKLSEFVYSLPFSLTQSQKDACREIVVDMEKNELMNRLLQGDVGTGKTLVSGIAIYANYLRGMQSALMAPTDALARQHYRFFLSLFDSTPLRVGLLVGALSASERKSVLEDLEEGKIDLIVGTHALFSKDVSYLSLGLAIIDEQHKFGVNQRATLASKGNDADLLLMSATPIPRTLSMALYGDLDVSTLKDFPFGKRDVETFLMRSNNKKIDAFIASSLASKKRVFVVAPQIEMSENEFASAKSVYEAMRNRYGDKAVLMHGKLSDEEKETALLAFQSGLCPILVATSVIEVGIDVKEADLMIVYEASHFALSSLHQLRGRIGRDGSKARFVMVYDGNDDEDREKLSVLLGTEDGFEIAEADLRLRGPGTLAGVKQSGLPEFRYANIIHDFKMFEAARNDASKIVSDMDCPDYQKALKAAISAFDIALNV